MIVCLTCAAENKDDAVQCVSCGNTPTLAPASMRSPVIDGSSPTIQPSSMAVSPGAGPTSPLPRMQERIAGRYEPTKILGRGGMGIVYRAHDHVLREETAIKVLLPSLVGDPKNAERLVREIKTARQITHPNVIRIHDFGLDGDEGYVSMEILPGGSLHERLQRGQIPIAEALEISIGICDGLAAAHAKGIIHRDLKPHNVLFDADGRPKLVDFGLARIADMTGQTQGFTGTPLYMSPEMTDGREINTRSDVYSTGVMLFELFCGQPPFKADTLMRLAMLHANEQPPKPTSLRPELPAALETILLKSLQKDPAHRFANAREMGEVLREFQRTGAAGSITIPITPPLTPAKTIPPPMARKTRAVRGATAFAAVFGVASLVAIAIEVGGFGKKQDVATPTPTAVAAFTATLAPTATPTPVAQTPTPAKTAKPQRTATPKPTALRTAVVIAPTPTPVAEPTTLAVTANPARIWVYGIPLVAEITIDKQTYIGKNVKSIAVAPGEHRIVWKFSDGREHSASVTVKAGESIAVHADFTGPQAHVEKKPPPQ